MVDLMAIIIEADVKECAQLAIILSAGMVYLSMDTIAPIEEMRILTERVITAIEMSINDNRG